MAKSAGSRLRIEAHFVRWSTRENGMTQPAGNIFRRPVLNRRRRRRNRREAWLGVATFLYRARVGMAIM